MKIIELLNLVYEKKAPKKILYKYCEYEFNPYEEDYINKDGLYLFSYLFDNEDQVLYIEVEIIEDNPKKIEELDNRHFDEINQVYCGKQELGEAVLVDKINELTKAVNYLLEKSDKDVS